MKPQVTNRKPRRKVEGSRLLVRCGDCHERLEIYYDEDRVGKPVRAEDSLEIGGVFATRAEWKKILKRVGL